MGLFDKVKAAFSKPKDYTAPMETESKNSEDVQGVQGVQVVQDVQETQNGATNPEVQEVQDAEETLDVHDVQDVQETQDVHEVQDGQDVPSTFASLETPNTEETTESVDTAEAVPTVESVPKPESSETVPTRQNIESAPKAESYETVPTRQNIESAPKVESYETVPSGQTVESVSTTVQAEQVEDEPAAYTKGLEKTRTTFGQKLNALFANFRTVDEDFFEEVEETLISSDVGFETAMKIAEQLRDEVKLKNAKKSTVVKNVIIEKMVDLYEAEGRDEKNTLNLQQDGLTVILFVGVNGVGKTTSIGKLANQYKNEGKKVLLAAADTFRAGAINQLTVWGERAGVEVVRGKEGGDPASVVYDAMEKALSSDTDILIVDTAGRLQNKVNLMNELDKMSRIIQKHLPNAPHEVLLVLDATTGQNAMVQAKEFKETTGVTGIVLTKLDGTAKGGIVLAIRNELHLPVKFVGLGEGILDLKPFNAEDFVVGMFSELLEAE